MIVWLDKLIMLSVFGKFDSITYFRFQVSYCFSSYGFVKCLLQYWIC